MDSSCFTALCLSIFNIGKALQKRSGETLSIVLLISQGKPFLPKADVKALGALFLSYLWLDGLEWDCMQGPLFLFPKPGLETGKKRLGTDPMAMPFGVKYIAFKLPLTFP